MAWLQAGWTLRRQFPSPPADNFLVGHAISMQSPQNHRWLSDMYRQLGPLMYVRLVHNHVSRIFCSSPQLKSQASPIKLCLETMR